MTDQDRLDLFAAHALSGLLAAGAMEKIRLGGGEDEEIPWRKVREEIAMTAYALAKDMEEARKPPMSQG